MRNFLTSCPLWPSRVARLCRGIMIPRHEVHPPSQEFDIASDLVTDYHIQLPEGSSDLIDLRCGVAEVEFCNIIHVHEPASGRGKTRSMGLARV